MALALIASGPARAEPLFLETVDTLEAQPGGTQDRFGEPLIDEAGRVVYQRRGTFGSPGRGIWVGDRASTPLVRAGDEAPGVSDGEHFASIGDPAIDGLGRIAFVARLETGSLGIFATDAAGALQLVAREGDPAPGLPTGARFGRLRPPKWSAVGVLAFSADLAQYQGGVNLDNFRTLWTWDASGARLAVRSDSQAPGLAPGTLFTFFGPPVLNRIGELAFRASLTLPGGGSVWGPGPGGDLELALRSGMPMPAAGSGARLFAVSTPNLTDAGDLVVPVTLERGLGGVDASNDFMLLRVSRFRESEILFREGREAPGAPDGALFSALFGRATSPAGIVAFAANLRSGGGGLWLAERGAAPQLVFRSGELLPGVGLRFESPSVFTLNTTGQLVCLCLVSDASGNLSRALLRRSPDGAIDLIARTGEQLLLAPGDVRRVSSLAFASLHDPENDPLSGSGLNERGEVAFRATFFPDGHARILRATMRAPEPPIADAGEDRVVECNSPEGARVELDGSASFDPDSEALAFSWSNSFGVRTGPVADVVLALGTHAVTLTVEDPSGLSDTDRLEIDVVDTSPPEIDVVAAHPDTLWPPNGRLFAVEVEVSARDACDPAPHCRIVDVATSEQGRRPSRATARLIDDLSVNLRARRWGRGDGRSYILTVECTDTAHNATRAEAEVRVPHRPARRKNRSS